MSDLSGDVGLVRGRLRGILNDRIVQRAGSCPDFDRCSAKKVFSRGSNSIREVPLPPMVCHSGAWSSSAESFSLSP